MPLDISAFLGSKPVVAPGRRWALRRAHFAGIKNRLRSACPAVSSARS